MSRSLLVFEDSHWQSLRPLTDLLPVPRLAFGGSTLAARWERAIDGALMGIEARGSTKRSAGVDSSTKTRPDDPIWVGNAAALPGPWLDDALSSKVPTRFECHGRIVAAQISRAAIEPGLGLGPGFEAFLGRLDLRTVPVEARLIRHPWDLIEWNSEAIEEDLRDTVAQVKGAVDPLAVLLEPRRITVEAGARVDPLAVLDARQGAIRIESEVIINPHTVVIGPCVVGAGSELLGGVIGRSTIGPQCRIAGEVDACIWQGYSNKRHHGFVGHSVIGEWVNLGALTTTSDLKNNYGSVRVWSEGSEVDTGLAKIGSLIGAHVKTGIGTLLPTGCWIGVGSNLFGGGRFVPKYVPPFSWWDGERHDEHRIESFLKTARVAMSRRGRSLDPVLEAALRALSANSADERRAPMSSRSAAPR